ncbi:SbtR family transcriptional regulator [Nocardia africana]|uniref:SbtR family transcriptional regulator n=1 Tax=Nocardia africana TaxID=134964 RepID=UPI0035A71015
MLRRDRAPSGCRCRHRVPAFPHPCRPLRGGGRRSGGAVHRASTRARGRRLRAGGRVLRLLHPPRRRGRSQSALCEALDDGDTAVAIPDRLRHDFIRSFDTLLSRAKAAGAVRPDIDVADVLDLVIGAATVERRARARDAPNPLIAVVLDGLRGPTHRTPA